MQNNYNTSEEEINLIFLWNHLIRNKLLIGSITSLIFIISCFYAISKKRIWQGSFDIVLSANIQNSNNKLSSLARNSSPLIGSLNGLSFFKQPNNLKTEIAILESPSTLLKTFSYVNEKKNKSTKNNQTFSNWRNSSLKIGLIEDTSVLNINYIDTDKSLIIPVLQKISETYQKYSVSKKKKELGLTQNYLQNQIQIFKDKSANSLRRAQEYAIDNGLEDFEITMNQPNALYEQFRLDLSTDLQKINNIINEIQNNELDANELRFIMMQFPNYDNSLGEIDNINKSLNDLKSKYKEKDKAILRLEEKKKILLDSYKKSFLTFLNLQKKRNTKLVNTAKSPKEVFLNYKNLVREASRNETIFVELENRYREIKLQQAKMQEPWELISSPTLNPIPVGPQRKLIAFIGLILGLITSLIISFLKEIKSELIFEKEKIEQLLDTKIIEEIDLINKKFIINSKDIFLNEILLKKDNTNYVFIKTPEVSEYQIQNLLNLLSIEGKKYRIISKISEIKNNDLVLLVCVLKLVSKSDLVKIKNRFLLSDKSLWRILLINE